MNELELWKRIEAMTKEMRRIADSLEKMDKCVSREPYQDGTHVFQTLSVDAIPGVDKA